MLFKITWTHLVRIATLMSLYLPRKAVHNALWLEANMEPFSENILANRATEPMRSDSSVDFSLNSS